MGENLSLWRAVERTDPAQVKPITGKAYRGNSPKPHFLVFKATETFGPCGIGWGFEIVEEKLLDGALLEGGFHERIHMARVRVWYEWDGKRGTVEHVGQTVFCGRRKSDNANRPGVPFTDEDAPKKSVTDALIKALSLIGFAGDIFMGRYDDSKYVADLKRQIADEAVKLEKPAELSADVLDAGKADFIKASFDSIRNAKDAKSLRMWWQSSDFRKAVEDFELDEDEFDPLKTAFSDRLRVFGRAIDEPRLNGRDPHSEGARAQ